MSTTVLARLLNDQSEHDLWLTIATLWLFDKALSLALETPVDDQLKAQWALARTRLRAAILRRYPGVKDWFDKPDMPANVGAIMQDPIPAHCKLEMRLLGYLVIAAQVVVTLPGVLPELKALLSQEARLLSVTLIARRYPQAHALLEKGWNDV